nr:hypothetical protein [uncultured Acetobacter sp.]
MPENSIGQKIAIGVLSLVLALGTLALCVFLGGQATYVLLHSSTWSRFAPYSWLVVVPVGVVLYFRLRSRTRQTDDI